MGLLDGKKAAIFGVANERSIAWAISEAFHAEGAELAFTFAGEILEKRVRPLAEGIGSKIILPCDVTKDEEIEKVFATLKQEWGGLDILVHAIAFANKEDLSNPYAQTSRAGFHLAMDVSAYSLVALAQRAAPLMEGRKGSIVTLTYMGSEKVIPNYNVMGVAKAALEASVRYLAHDLGPKGIRVNAISAGPLRTLAAAGISDFKSMLHHVAERAPLKRNIDAEEVGKTALYLVQRLGQRGHRRSAARRRGLQYYGNVRRLGKCECWSSGVLVSIHPILHHSSTPDTPARCYMAIKEVTPQQAHEILTNDARRRLHRRAHRARVRQWASGGRGEYSRRVSRSGARHDDERGLRQGRRSKLSSRQEDHRRLPSRAALQRRGGIAAAGRLSGRFQHARRIRRHARSDGHRDRAGLVGVGVAGERG